MSALILDVGALIAVDRGDPVVLAQIEEAGKTGDPVRTNAMTIAQVWRDDKGRQARRHASCVAWRSSRLSGKTDCGLESFSE